MRQRRSECLLEPQGSPLNPASLQSSPKEGPPKGSTSVAQYPLGKSFESSKLASYASPPLSPKHWAELDLRTWDNLMDGDQRKHEGSMSRSRTAPRRAPGRATESDPAIQPRGDPTGMSQPPDQAPMSYDYGYTASSFHGSLQSSDIPSYQDFVRGRQISALQRRRVPEYYDSMIYGFQGPTPGPFEVVPQYQNRPAAMDLATQFVPQYFAEESAESGVAGLSPFLNAPMPYNQPNPMVRPNTTQSFPSNIPDFTAIGSGSMNRLDQEPQQSDPSSLEEAIGQYQHLLRQTFDQTRAGRLAEAGASLTQISEWLVTNARELGKMMLFFSFFGFFHRCALFLVDISPSHFSQPKILSCFFFFLSLLFSVSSSSFFAFPDAQRVMPGTVYSGCR